MAANIVVVGYGMGRHHAQLIRKTGALTLYGVCDVDPAKRAQAEQEHGVRTFGDLGEVLADDQVSVVSIVTPHADHAPMAIQAMDAGRSVVTDKAMCLSVAEARAMIAARDRNRVFLTTFHNRRWDSDFLTVRRCVEEGLLGRLHHVESRVDGYSTGRPGGWRAQRQPMGGWLFDWGAHTLDQFTFLLPAAPVSVTAHVHYRDEWQSEVENFVQCTIRYADGATAMTQVSYMSAIGGPRWHILGERGALWTEGFDTPVKVKAQLGQLSAEMVVQRVAGDWQAFYDNVGAHCRGEVELAVQPEQLIRPIAIAQAAYISVAEQREVAMSEVLGAPAAS
jgi:predicted dehydrogenase